MKKNFILLSLLIFLCGMNLQAQKYQPNWESLDKRKVPEWFIDAKFGIFIHWGVYSVPAWGPKGAYSEWYWSYLRDTASETYKHHIKLYGKNFKYQDFAPMFKAELFDADKWADLFVKSGAKYIVPTSKHHEGFCLWPSAQSVNWNSMDIGSHRDLLGELTEAGRKRGLEMGFYYSLFEWNHPLYRNDFNDFVNSHFFPQFKDVVSRYKPSIIFTDGEWEKPSSAWRSPELVAWLFNESDVKDHVVINDRWGSETRSYHGGYYCTEYGGLANREMNEEHPWEENRGIGSSFGYNRNEDFEDYRSPGELIGFLATTVSQGGNLLLDIGPDADGAIPVIMQERLMQIGNWLKVNGEAIYSSRPYCAWKDGENVRFTQSKDGKYLYMILLDRLEKKIITKNVSVMKDSKITMLGTDQDLNYAYKNGELNIEIPESIFIKKPCDYAWVLKMEMMPYLKKPRIKSEKLLSDKPIPVEIRSKDAGAEIRYTLDGSEPVESSALYTQPVVIRETSQLKVKAFQTGFSTSIPATERFVIVDSKVNGVHYKYYRGKWDALPDFDSLKPEKSGTCFEISAAGITASRDNYGMVFTANLNIVKEANYKFYLASDDGSRLFVDGKRFVDNDSAHGTVEKTATVNLGAGKHEIKVEYFQIGGSAVLKLYYSSPDIEKQEIPASVLFLK
jgi:alpha-L-fucosidase